MWNNIPGIHDVLHDGRQRYLAFNMGRYLAFCDWFGASRLRLLSPAASGVGHRGEDLIVHALALAEPGLAIENPAQIPAYRYSSRYGPLPPCFVRARAVNQPEPLLLVSGTAAIRGEDAHHERDVLAQCEMTFENLRVLLRAAGCDGQEPLSSFTHIRVYIPDRSDWSLVASRTYGAFRATIELILAELCRQELLVEIEGLVKLSHCWWDGIRTA
jgi:enamine deaminase RidA (YjgF/YER057c/UK114 family)